MRWFAFLLIERMGVFVLSTRARRSRRQAGRATLAYNRAKMLSKIEACLDSYPAITLKQIATVSGVHRQTVERAIREAMGLTFREFREAVILRQALDLLRGNDGLSCKEIAFRLGYKSPAAFALFVKKVTGETPGQTRVTPKSHRTRPEFPELQHSA